MFLCAPVAHADTAAGTVAPPQANPVLVDGATGEAWAHVTSAAPASFVLTGPAKFQVGFRLNLPPNPLPTASAGIVQIRHGGRPLAQFRLQPKEGTDTWKDIAAMKPGVSVGFFVEVGPGPQTYEFRLNGAGDLGGAVRVVEASQSRRPLAANAPVVKAPVAAVTATPTPAPTAVAAATPEPKPPRVRRSPAGGPAFAAWVTGGKAWRSEQSVLGTSHHVWDASAGVRWNATGRTFVVLGGEWRMGTQRVPTIDAPPKDVREDRQSIDVAGGYRLPVAFFELALGPALRFTRQEDDVAPHDYLVGGGFARLTMPAGRLDLHAFGEAGAPIYDSTPEELQTGTLEARTAWGAGLSIPSRRNSALRVGLEYRGESIARSFTERVSHGAYANVQVGF